jgi:hypothetical protein
MIGRALAAAVAVGCIALGLAAPALADARRCVA